jgi:hypothetical protein
MVNEEQLVAAAERAAGSKVVASLCLSTPNCR